MSNKYLLFLPYSVTISRFGKAQLVFTRVVLENTVLFPVHNSGVNAVVYQDPETCYTTQRSRYRENKKAYLIQADVTRR